jgi:plasmid maintenance system antidote protein VapI
MRQKSSKTRPKKTLADSIRDEIHAQGWSALALSKETGVPQPTITRFLNGADLRLSTADKLCDVLGLAFR